MVRQLKEQLADSSRAVADMTAHMVCENPELFSALLQIALSEEMPYAPRAARVVTICSLQIPRIMFPYRNKIIRSMAHMQNEGVIRNLLKMYAEIAVSYTKTEREALMNLCFDKLTDPNMPVAIKIFCMQVLYNISLKEPDIGNELYHIIENELPYSTAAYKSRGRKMMQMIKRNGPPTAG